MLRLYNISLIYHIPLNTIQTTVKMCFILIVAFMYVSVFLHASKKVDKVVATFGRSSSWGLNGC